ncbi:MAG: hypothetical protein GWP58_08250 [Gammaproteobacteria bacterium]|jgi:hypothetical protein|nr:hypothetical protein [Gammaproteobacteria bacterium]
MELTSGIFMFIVALAAVVNGLGIVRIVGGAGELLRRRESLNITYYWVHSLLVLFQLLTHVLLWWAYIGLREVNSINFLQYLYVLIGPILLFLATSLLIPDFTDNKLDLRAAYWRSRKSYYSILTVFWPWTMFIWPVFGYPMAPTWKFAVCWMTIMITLRLTDHPRVHAVLVSASWLLMSVFIGIYAMQLGGVANLMIK